MQRESIYVIRYEGQSTIFSIKIENVDYSNADELIRELTKVMAGGSSIIVIDISKVRYFDYSGMNFLTTAERLRILKNGRVRLTKCFSASIRNEEVATAFFRAHNS
ncbi:MAG: STAS domain-containing protein [Ignavibacteriae bacterium]|nr:STAS domain-containing protein [Ignavibacteriota bacterium]